MDKATPVKFAEEQASMKDILLFIWALSCMSLAVNRVIGRMYFLVVILLCPLHPPCPAISNNGLARAKQQIRGYYRFDSNILISTAGWANKGSHMQ
jgi:hypothetical protein